MALSAEWTAQEAPLQESDRVRQQLDRLLAGVSALAAEGNSAGTLVLDMLRRQGVTYTPPRS